MSSRRALTTLALFGAVLVLAACRSDGGVGRRDAVRSMRWTLGAFERQHAADVENTQRNLDDLGDWFADEVTHPTEKMEHTMALYLEGNARR